MAKPSKEKTKTRDYSRTIITDSKEYDDPEDFGIDDGE